MRTALLRSFAALSTFATLGAVAGAQTTASSTTTTTTTTVTTTVVAPAVGDMAPDFTMPWADASGARAKPVALKALRGKVVVLAFYPKDRTTGCTAEMTKFRDEYKTLFGDNVVVLPVSADGLDSHTSWASDAKFPFALVSDTSLALADMYGSRMAGQPMSSRTVYVIDKNGRIVYRELKFNALSEDAYAAMASAIAAAR